MRRFHEFRTCRKVLRSLFRSCSKRTMDPMSIAKTHSPMYGVDMNKPYETATFAAGCFWGVEKFYRYSFFKSLRATAVGYIGGSVPEPTYKQVCAGTTGHAEAIQVQYFPDQVSYKQLCEYFFRVHDPTTLNRQGNDRGTQYRSAIFAHSPEQAAIARDVLESYKAQWAKAGEGSTISTEIVTIAPEEFKFAEVYHQLYLEKNPGGYCNHRLRFCSSEEEENLKPPAGYKMYGQY